MGTENKVEDVSVSTKASALFEITRPANSVFGGVATVIGAFVGGFAGFEAFPAILAAAVTTMGTGAGNAVNDYFDADIDAVNRPERPIPSGRVSRAEALVLSLVLLGAAFALTIIFLPTLAIGIGVINLVALITYSSHFKRIPLVGNLVVAYLTGSAFLFGGAAVGGVEYTVVLAVLAFFATLGREIVKDVEDIEGDKEAGAKTLPLVWGAKKSLYLASTSVVLSVLLSPVPYFYLDAFGTGYLVSVLPADIVLLAATWWSWDSPPKGQKYLKAGMFVAMLAFVAARLLKYR